MVNLDISPRFTKRVVLSTLARLYDPLGWISPVVVQGKILMQELWKQKLACDEELPPETSMNWKAFFQSLPKLSGVSIPRWNRYHPDNVVNELLGFADASTKAYAAVVYLRTIDPQGNVSVNLLASKTRVAPFDVV